MLFLGVRIKDSGPEQLWIREQYFAFLDVLIRQESLRCGSDFLRQSEMTGKYTKGDNRIWPPTFPVEKFASRENGCSDGNFIILLPFHNIAPSN